MYGQPSIKRSEAGKQTDEAFIREATQQYGDRQAGSRALADEGWKYLRSGKPELAIIHFNQAWLLDAKNYQPYWGFGAILSDQGILPDAIEQLETARELVEDQKQKVALLADLGAVYSAYASRMPVDNQLDRAQYFVNANQCFAESLDLDPNYPASWREWAFSLYEQDRFSEAWLRANRAMELKAEAFPADFLNKLREKMNQSGS